MLQIVRQSWQERYEMYMKLPKEELAKMLAESAKYTNPDGCSEFSRKDDYNATSGLSYTEKDDFIFWR